MDTERAQDQPHLVEQARQVVSDWVAGGKFDQPRDAAGKFIPEPTKEPPAAPPPPVPSTDNAPPAAPTAAAPPPVAAPPPAEPPAPDMIEGRLDDGTIVRIPASAKLDLKVSGKAVTLTAAEAMQRATKVEGADRRFQEAAEQRRQLEQLERELNAREARLSARDSFLRDLEELAVKAQTDPEAQQQYEQHLDQYRNNPFYRKMVDAGLNNVEAAAELSVRHQEDEATMVEEGTQMVLNWVDELAADPRFAGVDPVRARAIYGDMLERGVVGVDRAVLERIFANEALHVSSTQKPLLDELAQLKAQVAALEGRQAGERHNRQTDHALQRDKSVPTATGGQPPAPAPPEPRPFGPRDLAQRTADWIRQR